MTQKVTIKISENHLPEIAAKLRNLERVLPAEEAQTLAADIRKRAPAGTRQHPGPRLKDSVTVEPAGPSRWQVVVNAAHGLFVNFGTVHMSARPFFSQAKAAAIPRFFERFKRALGNLR